MKSIGIPIAVSLALLVAAARTQTPPQVTTLVTRMNSAYRGLQSYYDVSTIKRKVGAKDAPASLTLAIQKPNKYLLELKGDYLNTVIVSDGSSLVAFRPDRKVYTKSKAPLQIIKSDFIGKVDMPSLGARIISLLLAANGRDGDLGALLLKSKVSGPEPLGDKQVYVLAFPYGEGTEAQVSVSTDDYLIRQVKVVKNGEVDWLETHDSIQTDKPVPAGVFNFPIPDGARMIAELPELEKPAEAVAAAPDGQAQSDSAGSSATRAAAALGIFRKTGCARCHQIDGQGGSAGPDLSHEGSETGRTARWIADHIRNPRTHNPDSSMPSFGTRIAGADLGTLSSYLASLK